MSEDPAPPRPGAARTSPKPEDTEASEGQRSASLLPEVPSWALVIICILLSLFALYAGRSVVLPFMVAVILKLLLSPLVRGLAAWRVPEPLGAFLVMLAAGGCLGYAAYALSAPVAEWAGRVPQGLDTLGGHLQVVIGPLKQLQEGARSLSAIVSSSGGSGPAPVAVPPTDIGGIGLVVFSETASLIAGLGATIVLLYFLLAAGDSFLRRLVTVLPRFHDKKQAVEIARQVQLDISRYLLTITAINFLLGAAVAVALYATGMPNPALWGAMVALFNYMPFLGPALSFTVITTVAMMSFHSLQAVLLPPALFLALVVVESHFITPAALAQRLTLNPVAVVLSLIFWTWMWNVPGALLAVPMLAAFKIVCDRIQSLQPIGAFLSR